MPRIRVPRLVADYFALRNPAIDYFTHAARPGDSARRAARRRLLHPRRASGSLATSRDLSSTTSPTSRVWVPRHVARLVVWLIANYFASRRLIRRASRCLDTSSGSSSTTSPTPRVWVPRNVARLVVWLIVDYSASRRFIRRASKYLGTSRNSSSTTSPTPRVRVPRYVARLVTRLVALLFIYYFASRRLVVDYFTYVAPLSASARRATRRAAHRRLLRPRRVSGCLGTSRGPSRGLLSTTPCVATSSCSHTSSTSATSCVVTTCLAATLALLRVRRASPRRHLPVASHRPFISTSFPN
jgi:hypothetical protein